jgi:hypothetical protein
MSNGDNGAGETPRSVPLHRHDSNSPASLPRLEKGAFVGHPLAQSQPLPNAGQVNTPAPAASASTTDTHTNSSKSEQ